MTTQPQEDAAPARRRTGRIAAAAALTAAVGVGLIACGQGGQSAAAPDVTVKNAATTQAGRAPAPLPESKPTGLRIPAAGVDAARMLDLGIGADGALEVPPVAKAEVPGWWTGGVTPGQKGAAVLVAHYDTVNGPALMRNVARVKVGDAIMVPRADGSTARFRVHEIQQVDKKDFPTHKVYGATDRPELRLLTCGGPIRNGHRADNIILYADLVR
ncbi:class F sortase [Streptomyces sp. MNP-20]|uniref:class F sortase n=1 Tax=Streptomyces sp. MNP-20 TaxID=2721165 RepID=UPI001552B5B6|nr:class F sortase [Streptomyces sp. MNP-20]